MKASTKILRTKFRGAVLGLAVGDALGFPFKGRSRTFLKAKTLAPLNEYSPHDSGFYPPGQFSDDTQTAIRTAEAILEHGEFRKDSVFQHLLPLWRDQVVIDRSESSAAAIDELLRGRKALEESGLPPGHIEADAMARAVPIGLWYRDNLNDMTRAVGESCSITHQDLRVHAAAAGLAAAVAHNVKATDLVLGIFLDTVSAAAGRFHGEMAEWIVDMPRVLSLTESRVFEELLEAYAPEEDSTTDVFEIGVPNNAPLLFLLAIYYFLKSPLEADTALSLALQTGGEVTTLCALVGSIVGAYLGDTALPEKLAYDVLERPVLVDLADGLADGWE